MTPSRVSTDDDFQARVRAARAMLRSNGMTITDWARANGFSRRTVYCVLSGARGHDAGIGHRIAVALGIKDRPKTPPAGQIDGQPLAIAA